MIFVPSALDCLFACEYLEIVQTSSITSYLSSKYEVEERVLKAIRAWDRFPADKETMLKLEADFSKDLGFDSLDQVEIMMAVEDEFGFEIPLEDSEKLKTPRDVFKYICEREDVYE
ncbi:unnamed protein product [Cylicostephanus goldi]|uniref:Acyl carrier protein n=1 Tax=Cylicostephanus goldi TaxID=71465 RepID=A0A3P6R2M4_CYLGO|nr:unnamed protein product [Cylicostephanus goldi]